MFYSEECMEMAYWVASSHRVVPGSNRTEAKVEIDEPTEEEEERASVRMRLLL